MDAGAHFFCCDLQVHSPRDRYWNGQCPNNEEERKHFARDFVFQCRAKGIQAVAITDHHDLAFFPYICDAAREERDLEGNSLADQTKLVVFPALELTLAVPCQALLIFDPGLSDESLEAAIHALGIEQAPVTDIKCKEVAKLRFTSLREVSDSLGALESVRGRFILLPNVNASGKESILRNDFTEHYKHMPCVGGYVDGNAEGHRKQQILDGKEVAWGNKKLGVIQTSDSRHADFSKLGAFPTWIKWSSPSAEAVRQACLSPSSRLRYKPPLVPDTWIASMEVSASKYFGPISVEFNPQLNATIGGRGTGKSTILEYLRWALCDQPYVHSGEGDNELPNFEKRRRSLVSGTLEPSHGSVKVTYIRHGVTHRIRREAGTNKVYLAIGDQPEKETTEEVIQSLAQIQGYSQKQLSHVSVRTQELERLLTAPIAQDLAVAEAELKSLSSSLRQTFEKRESVRNLKEQWQALQLDLESKKQQADALTQQVKDLPEAQRRTIDAHPYFSEGERAAKAFKSSFSTANSTVLASRDSIQKLLDDLPSVGRALPSIELSAIREVLAAGLGAMTTQLNELSVYINAQSATLSDQFAAAEQKLREHREAYDAAASENAVVQERLASLKAVSQLIANAEADRILLMGKIDEAGDVEGELSEARQRWLDGLERKRRLLEKQAAELEKDSDGQLRVRIGLPKNGAQLATAVQNSVSGASITRPEKFEGVVSRIISNPTPIIEWIKLCEELIGLAVVGPRLDSGAALPSTPQLTGALFTETELGRIARRLKPNAAFELSLLSPEGSPVFEYKTQQGGYAPFEEASPGQQATALISLLLNQSAGPLVVDQPEDDLDNLTIMEIAERLWKAKEKRQIIFSTHNPNLVVIGDAELVLHCAYSPLGSSVRLQIPDQGAIDNEEVCDVISRVMEGGEEAFRLRQEKYGF